MKRLLLITLAVAQTACASLKSNDAPGCSGPRRPANPHGSVLAPDEPASAATPAPVASGCVGGAR